MVVVSHQFKANAIEADLRAKAINSKGVRTSNTIINRPQINQEINSNENGHVIGNKITVIIINLTSAAHYS